MLLIQDAVLLTNLIFATDAVTASTTIFTEEQRGSVLTILTVSRREEGNAMQALITELTLRDVIGVHTILGIVRLVAIVRILIHNT